jgi:predicted flap endonuclease-1-like 5' DNA nuclease
LESRVRHLEERAAGAPAPAAHINGGETETAAPSPALAPPVPEERPVSLPAANAGAPDDFTLIDGVSPLQQSSLYSLGIYHFDQIAAWTPANVAWVDRYLRLRGRITEEEWIEQAAELAQFGVVGARPQGEGARA